MRATFVIGEHSFLHLGSSQDDSAAVEAFVSLLDSAQEQGTVLAWEDLFSAPVVGFESLSEFLFGMNTTLDRDVRLLLGVELQKASTWGEADGNPPYNLTDGSSALDFSPSVGLCLLHVARAPWAVLCLRGGPFAGACRIQERNDHSGGRPIWFIDETGSLSDFWRDSFLRYRAAPSEIGKKAQYAFPTTVFAPAVWSQVGRFEGAWNEVRERLIGVLGGLDDGMVQTFEEVVHNHERISRMSSHYGVDCSPESSQTHRNAAAMRERKAQFADRIRDCEWHAKLEPHRNRVHFCVEGGQVYVGIFTRHLL
ncbi:hypothetical protein FHX52_3023 [Humibacillus xanthopallidus]|uniref:Uncharacterized protein n=1 Tax=Humibacillus xanthopallidus TaxID=412689 RepID=A0A543PQF8_9MICO|nr:hypothetical protein FHX52_3023 [Humibacillus xanthopallidus]